MGVGLRLLLKRTLRRSVLVGGELRISTRVIGEILCGFCFFS